MCDLIDLNSSNPNKVLEKKLASPLIPPPPAGSGNDVQSLVTNDLPCMIEGEKRNSLDNNPFDQVFKETAEYVRKKEDPFEIVLEKVTSNPKKKSKRQSVEFKDDFHPKQRKYADVLKMNKTLDDSLINIDPNTSLYCSRERSIIEDLNNIDLLNENVSRGENIPLISLQTASPLNNSILNYSAMNDSLTESNTNAINETAIRSLVAKRVSMCIQRGIMEAEGMLNPNNYHHLKLINCKRSLSQNDRPSPKKFESRQRSHSIMDTKRKFSRSNRSTLSSMPSIEFDDQWNKAFMQEQYSEDNSVFFDVSNISDITRLSSISSVYNSSNSLFSNGTINQGFIKSGSSSQISPGITLSTQDTRKSIRSNSTSTVVSSCASEIARSDIYDLREKFQALKVKLCKSSDDDSDIDKALASGSSEKIEELESNVDGVMEEKLIGTSGCQIESKSREDDKKEERLIDVEAFIPSDESQSVNSKSSFSNSSSESVFNTNEADKSIWNEARKLAKTFEELAEDKSNTYGYDLLSSHTQFEFDQLPDSDDEVFVANLIDLPPSPLKSEAPPNSPMEIESLNQAANDSQKELNKVKEIEMEFIEPKDPETKIKATSLLIELEKLIKTEKNPDAEKLLNQLEQVLGVKWDNNTDLLRDYLQNAKSNMKIDDGSQNKDADNKILENKDVANVEDTKSVECVKVEKNQNTNSYEEDRKEGFKRRNSCVIKKETPEMRKMQYSSGLRRSISRRSSDPGSKVEPSFEKSILDDMAVSQVSIRNNSQSTRGKLKSQILGVQKRFPSDSQTLNQSRDMEKTNSTTASVEKQISSKVPEMQRSTIPSMASAVRNKLKNKSETGVSKKGPMKATIPFGNMQRRGSFGKKVSLVAEPETPNKNSQQVPPVFTVTSSTPNSSITSILFKESKSKPVASSTPDSKGPRMPTIKPPSPRKRNFSCNISPVPVSSRSVDEKMGSKQSSKGDKIFASPPKRPSTPIARRPPRTPSGIPKYPSRPQLQRRKSMNDLNKSTKSSESPQSVPKASSLRKTPNSAKEVRSEPLKSCLGNANKMDLKVKPFNLISKLRGRGSEFIEAEKENYS